MPRPMLEKVPAGTRGLKRREGDTGEKQKNKEREGAEPTPQFWTVEEGRTLKGWGDRTEREGRTSEETKTWSRSRIGKGTRQDSMNLMLLRRRESPEIRQKEQQCSEVRLNHSPRREAKRSKKEGHHPESLDIICLRRESLLACGKSAAQRKGEKGEDGRDWWDRTMERH